MIVNCLLFMTVHIVSKVQKCIMKICKQCIMLCTFNAKENCQYTVVLLTVLKVFDKCVAHCMGIPPNMNIVVFIYDFSGIKTL